MVLVTLRLTKTAINALFRQQSRGNRSTPNAVCMAQGVNATNMIDAPLAFTVCQNLIIQTNTVSNQLADGGRSWEQRLDEGGQVVEG